MRPSYFVAASLAASVVLSPVLATAADTGTKAVRPAAATPAPIQGLPPVSGLSPASSEKVGCGAVLMILGKVADGYPDLFAKDPNGKAIQTVLSALGFKGRAMMDEGFAEGNALGLTPAQTYESGVSQVLQLVKPKAGGKAEDLGREAGAVLMQRCTGMTGN
jgi:hypothetical protein